MASVKQSFRRRRPQGEMEQNVPIVDGETFVAKLMKLQEAWMALGEVCWTLSKNPWYVDFGVDTEQRHVLIENYQRWLSVVHTDLYVYEQDNVQSYKFLKDIDAFGVKNFGISARMMSHITKRLCAYLRSHPKVYKFGKENEALTILAMVRVFTRISKYQEVRGITSEIAEADEELVRIARVDASFGHSMSVFQVCEQDARSVKMAKVVRMAGMLVLRESVPLHYADSVVKMVSGIIESMNFQVEGDRMELCVSEMARAFCCASWLWKNIVVDGNWTWRIEDPEGSLCQARLGFERIVGSMRTNCSILKTADVQIVANGYLAVLQSHHDQLRNATIGGLSSSVLSLRSYQGFRLAWSQFARQWQGLVEFSAPFPEKYLAKVSFSSGMRPYAIDDMTAQGRESVRGRCVAQMFWKNVSVMAIYGIVEGLVEFVRGIEGHGMQMLRRLGVSELTLKSYLQNAGWNAKWKDDFFRAYFVARFRKEKRDEYAHGLVSMCNSLFFLFDGLVQVDLEEVGLQVTTNVDALDLVDSSEEECTPEKHIGGSLGPCGDKCCLNDTVAQGDECENWPLWKIQQQSEIALNAFTNVRDFEVARLVWKVCAKEGFEDPIYGTSVMRVGREEFTGLVVHRFRGGKDETCAMVMAETPDMFLQVCAAFCASRTVSTAEFASLMEKPFVDKAKVLAVMDLLSKTRFVTGEEAEKLILRAGNIGARVYRTFDQRDQYFPTEVMDAVDLEAQGEKCNQGVVNKPVTFFEVHGYHIGETPKPELADPVDLGPFQSEDDDELTNYWTTSFSERERTERDECGGYSRSYFDRANRTRSFGAQRWTNLRNEDEINGDMETSPSQGRKTCGDAHERHAMGPGTNGLSTEPSRVSVMEHVGSSRFGYSSEGATFRPIDHEYSGAAVRELYVRAVRHASEDTTQRHAVLRGALDCVFRASNERDVRKQVASEESFCTNSCATRFLGCGAVEHGGTQYSVFQSPGISKRESAGFVGPLRNPDDFSIQQAGFGSRRKHIVGHDSVHRLCKHSVEDSRRRTRELRAANQRIARRVRRGTTVLSNGYFRISDARPASTDALFRWSGTFGEVIWRSERGVSASECDGRRIRRGTDGEHSVSAGSHAGQTEQFSTTSISGEEADGLLLAYDGSGNVAENDSGSKLTELVCSRTFLDDSRRNEDVVLVRQTNVACHVRLGELDGNQCIVANSNNGKSGLLECRGVVIHRTLCVGLDPECGGRICFDSVDARLRDTSFLILERGSCASRAGGCIADGDRTIVVRRTLWTINTSSNAEGGDCSIRSSHRCGTESERVDIRSSLSVDATILPSAKRNGDRCPSLYWRGDLVRLHARNVVNTCIEQARVSKWIISFCTDQCFHWWCERLRGWVSWLEQHKCCCIADRSNSGSYVNGSTEWARDSTNDASSGTTNNRTRCGSQAYGSSEEWSRSCGRFYREAQGSTLPGTTCRWCAKGSERLSLDLYGFGTTKQRWSSLGWRIGLHFGRLTLRREGGECARCCETLCTEAELSDFDGYVSSDIAGFNNDRKDYFSIDSSRTSTNIFVKFGAVLFSECWRHLRMVFQHLSSVAWVNAIPNSICIRRHGVHERDGIARFHNLSSRHSWFSNTWSARDDDGNDLWGDGYELRHPSVQSKVEVQFSKSSSDRLYDSASAVFGDRGSFHVGLSRELVRTRVLSAGDWNSSRNQARSAFTRNTRSGRVISRKDRHSRPFNWISPSISGGWRRLSDVVCMWSSNHIHQWVPTIWNQVCLFLSGLLLGSWNEERSAIEASDPSRQRTTNRKGITTSPSTIGASANCVAERRGSRLTDSRAFRYRAISVYLLFIATMANQNFQNLDPQAQWTLTDVTTRENAYKERQYAARDRARMAGLVDEKTTGVKNTVAGDPSRMDADAEWFYITQQRVELMRQYFDEKSLDMCRDRYGSVKLEKALYDLREHTVGALEFIPANENGWTGVRAKRSVIFSDLFVEIEAAIPVVAEGIFYPQDAYWHNNLWLYAHEANELKQPDELKILQLMHAEQQSWTADGFNSEFEWRKEHPFGIIVGEYVRVTEKLLRNYYDILKRNLYATFPVMKTRVDGGQGARA